MSNLATTPRNTAIAKPSFIKEGDVRGSEEIGVKDVKFPALKLAQSMSPETKRVKAEYIEGLVEGQFFNSITKEIYGEEALTVVVVKQLGHRNVEFDPNDRKIVIDGNVPDGDSRTEFYFVVENGAKVRKPPIAVTFYDYLVILYRDGSDPSPMTISLKKTQIKKALEWNTLLKGKVPTFAKQFTVEPVPDSRPKGVFYGWKISLVGWVTEEQYRHADKLYSQMIDKNLEVEREGEGDAAAAEHDDIPF